MTIRHLNDRHYHWKDRVDYAIFWIFTFSAVVLGSGIFCVVFDLPEQPERIPVTGNSRRRD